MCNVDNRVFLEAILDIFAREQGVKDLVRSKADQAYEAFGVSRSGDANLLGGSCMSKLMVSSMLLDTC